MRYIVIGAALISLSCSSEVGPPSTNSPNQIYRVEFFGTSGGVYKVCDGRNLLYIFQSHRGADIEVIVDGCPKVMEIK